MIENEEATLSYFPKIKSHCVWTASTVRSLKALRVETGKWKMMKNSSPPRETPQHLNIGFAYHQESFIFHPSKKKNSTERIFGNSTQLLENKFFHRNSNTRCLGCKLFIISPKCSRSFSRFSSHFQRTKKKEGEEWKLDPSCCDIEKHIINMLSHDCWVGGSAHDETRRARMTSEENRILCKFYGQISLSFIFYLSISVSLWRRQHTEQTGAMFAIKKSEWRF